MSEQSLEPRAPEIEAFLRSVRSLESPPAGEKKAVLANIEALVVAGAVVQAAAHGSGATATGAQVAATAKAFIGIRLVTLAVTFTVGGAVGAGFAALALRTWPPAEHARAAAPVLQGSPLATPQVVPVPAAEPSATPPQPPPAPATEPEAPKSPAARSQAAVRPLAHAKKDDQAPVRVEPLLEQPSVGGTLSEEQALLRPVRPALANGQTAEAIGQLEQHAKQFPDGQLAQEREALWVQALVAAKRFDEARSRGAAFEQRFPGSMLLPTVRNSLELIPADSPREGVVPGP
jgi:hypothetical protein